MYTNTIENFDENKAFERSCMVEDDCVYHWQSATCRGKYGINNGNCKVVEPGKCTCENPDKYAPQCTKDSDCTWGTGRPYSTNKNRGSNNCKRLGAFDAECATPYYQCKDNSHCKYNWDNSACKSTLDGGSVDCKLKGYSCECLNGSESSKYPNYIPDDPLNWKKGIDRFTIVDAVYSKILPGENQCSVSVKSHLENLISNIWTQNDIPFFVNSLSMGNQCSASNGGNQLVLRYKTKPYNQIKTLIVKDNESGTLI